MHKILCEFEILMDHLIPARRQNPVLFIKKKPKNEQNKTKNLLPCALSHSRGLQSENQKSKNIENT